MDSGAQFERLIRMVQETGERMVVSLEKGRDPIVLLPLSVYEQLVQRNSENAYVQAPVRASEPVPARVAPPVRRDGEAGRSYAQPSQRPSQQMSPSFTPSAATASVSAIEHDDPADVWDGETGEEYDSERIFAAATGIPRGNEAKLTSSFSGSGAAPDERLRAPSVRASDGLGAVRRGGGEMGSGGQRLPIRSEALRGEERFSLGMG